MDMTNIHYIHWMNCSRAVCERCKRWSVENQSDIRMFTGRCLPGLVVYMMVWLLRGASGQGDTPITCYSRLIFVVTIDLLQAITCAFT